MCRAIGEKSVWPASGHGTTRAYGTYRKIFVISLEELASISQPSFPFA